MAKRLYVGNLPYSTRDEDLADAFAQVGEVAEAIVMIDRETGRSRGFGFVEMADDADADAAVEQMDGTMLDGRAIRVSIARPRGESRGRDW
ncbi:MAG: RNA-binding protein [Chloroflexi bacterium]|nr:RNA-binding protein [Chloroflexota bacterium]